MPDWDGRIARLATGSAGFLFSLAPEPAPARHPPGVQPVGATEPARQLTLTR